MNKFMHFCQLCQNEKQKQSPNDMLHENKNEKSARQNENKAKNKPCMKTKMKKQSPKQTLHENKNEKTKPKTNPA